MYWNNCLKFKELNIYVNIFRFPSGIKNKVCDSIFHQKNNQ